MGGGLEGGGATSGYEKWAHLSKAAVAEEDKGENMAAARLVPTLTQPSCGVGLGNTLRDVYATP